MLVQDALLFLFGSSPIYRFGFRPLSLRHLLALAPLFRGNLLRAGSYITKKRQTRTVSTIERYTPPEKWERVGREECRVFRSQTQTKHSTSAKGPEMPHEPKWRPSLKTRSLRPTEQKGYHSHLNRDGGIERPRSLTVLGGGRTSFTLACIAPWAFR